MERPTFSVVIPSYNRSRYLRAALESVLGQTAPAHEIIVVDDGSTDDTREILNRYAGRTVRAIHQANRGKSAARNVGIQAATGEYIAFLDADDVWNPDHLEALRAAMDLGLHDVGFFFTNYSEWRPDGSVLDGPLESKSLFPVFRRYGLALADFTQGTRPLTLGERRITCRVGPMAAQLFFGNFILTSTVACKRSLFTSAGYFPERFVFAEDWDEWIRLAGLCNFAYLDYPTIRYRYHPEQAIHLVERLQSADLILQVLEHNRAVMETMGAALQRKARRRLARAYRSRGTAELLAGKQREARADYLMSLRYHASHAPTLAYLLACALPDNAACRLIDVARDAKRSLQRALRPPA